MRNDSYTLEQARTQRSVFLDALIDAEGAGATGEVLQAFALDYWNASARVVNLELARYRADCPPQDFKDDDRLAVLSDEEDGDRAHLKKLEAAGPSHYTAFEHIDATMACILSHGKWRIVFHRKDRPPDRPQFTTLRGERIPIVRTLPSRVTRKKKS